jgi:hypothetical protein
MVKRTIWDRYHLYSAAVQEPAEDLRFIQSVYEQRHEHPLQTIREDFCGTALIASEWVRQNRLHRAWGLDLDPEVLEWALAHYLPRLGQAAERLSLKCGNVLDWRGPQAQAAFAFNTSYGCFKSRGALRQYFENARQGLQPGGLFVLDVTGGTETVRTGTFKRRVPASVAFDGTKVPSFTYALEQEPYDPETNGTLFHLHFQIRGHPPYRRAFTYDYRLWSLRELKEIMLEAGFCDVEVYPEGWHRSFRGRKRVVDAPFWMAYVTGWR